ncbi:hypothetical protein [Bacillus pacificus]|uniref:hypothetical protein n=1 Tax=Bacillus pacificus TaxID=2026187 RepID=UPI002E251DE0|nr:hypothetical protein [Bacillus pacificus]
MFAYTLTALTLCCISIIITSYISKRNGTLMEYMVFIMSFSMSIGLSIGFYLGILFKGELLYSTLLAISISVVIIVAVFVTFPDHTPPPSPGHDQHIAPKMNKQLSIG